MLPHMPLSLHLYFMKIGILTLPLHTNYGGILQAYALQTVLERMGHEVMVIDTPNMKATPSFLTMGKRIAKRALGKRVEIFLERRHNREYPIISQYIQPFIDKYIHRKEISSLHELRKENFDAIVVGSDQVWRPLYFTSLFKTNIRNAYLAFAEDWNIKRIAYAASFGTDDWEYTPKQTIACRELLRKFDAVSVREESGVQLCKEHFGVEAQHVLDPTMLLDKEDYIHLIETTETTKSKGTLLNYILDETPEKCSLMEQIAKDKGLIPFRVNSKVEDRTAPLEERIQPPVEQWLRGFYDAEFVVTDSFHACVFSILFNKPFVVIGNKERGMARFSSLLRLFNLESRMIVNFDDFKSLSDTNFSVGDFQEIQKQPYYFLSKFFTNEQPKGINYSSRL